MKFTPTSLILLTVATFATAKNPFALQNKNSAQAKLNSRLVSNSRRLNDAEEEEVEVDLTGYNLKFEKCQFIKAYDDEMAEDEETSTVLSTKRFIVFKLCSGSCNTCNYNYGEYLVDLYEYLEAMEEYLEEVQGEYCDACDENCAVEEEEEEAEDEEADEDEDEDEDAEDEDEDNDRRRRRKLVDVDCDTCADECDTYQNMNDYGYYDAFAFAECEQIYDPEDDGADGLFAGPMCGSSGSAIKIGVFSDEYCSEPVYGKSAVSYMVNEDGESMQLYDTLLKKTYTDVCISCLVEEEEEENDEDEDNEDEEEEEKEAEVLDLCMNVYENAAKCENAHGFSSGYENNANYYNQASNEDTVCDFIDSVQDGAYDSEGEISLYGANTQGVNGGTRTTGTQKFFLTFFIAGTVALGVYGGVLHNKLTQGGNAGLSSQGGAMA